MVINHRHLILLRLLLLVFVCFWSTCSGLSLRESECLLVWHTEPRHYSSGSVLSLWQSVDRSHSPALPTDFLETNGRVYLAVRNMISFCLFTVSYLDWFWVCVSILFARSHEVWRLLVFDRFHMNSGRWLLLRSKLRLREEGGGVAVLRELGGTIVEFSVRLWWKEMTRNSLIKTTHIPARIQEGYMVRWVYEMNGMLPHSEGLTSVYV